MASPSTPSRKFLPRSAIGLHVADDGLDGGASAQLAADDWRDAAFLAYDEDCSAFGFGAMAAKPQPSRTGRLITPPQQSVNAAPLSGCGPHRLSITHKLHADHYAELDIH